jgi:hypothetical protein
MSTSKLHEEISKLPEETLTLEVIIPLVRILHPGKVEYTHSSVEAGRDIISVGTDNLHRQHILCIQVKAVSLSYGSRFISLVVNPCELAKTEGVTLFDGTKVFPNEVWCISSSAFSASNRRQVSDNLERLSRQNIKLIAGEELCELISEHIPEVKYKYLSIKSDEIQAIIEKLSKHYEGRAFDISVDKYISQFFVDTDISPSAEYVWLFLNGQIDVTNISKNAITRKAIKNSENRSKQIEILRKDSNNEALCAFFENYSIEFSIAIINEIDVAETVPDEEARVEVIIDIEYKNRLTTLKSEVLEKIKVCPKEISGNVQFIKELLDNFFVIRKILSHYRNDNKNMFIKEEIQNNIKELRITLNEPQELLNISKTLIIEADAGHGKTTLLKMLAIRLLEKSMKTLYIPCFALQKNNEENDLCKIISANTWFKYPESWKSEETILLLDGLDEASEDISEIIIKNYSKYKNIIVTSRCAYTTPLRKLFPVIKLPAFSKESRNEFFQKWFNNSKEYYKKAIELCTEYPDIDENSRVPLLATIIAVLIENGFRPTNRVEIYEHRLDLLLWKWDHSRGIKRTLIDNVDAKKRFLMNLAFTLHSFPERRRIMKMVEIKEVFEKSLGNFGYQIEFSDLIDDLIINNGVLNKESNNTYSFGHLSFQEHLAGMYLYKNIEIHNIVKYLESDWWKEPLLFYSLYKSDLTEFVDYVIKHKMIVTNIDLIIEMVKNAQYTSPGAVDILKEYAIID